MCLDCLCDGKVFTVLIFYAGLMQQIFFPSLLRVGDNKIGAFLYIFATQWAKGICLREIDWIILFDEG
jgi:hypothetical protein